MNNQPFDLLTRRIARATSRRSALAVGGPAVAAIPAAALVGEAKKGKNGKKKSKKRCMQQVAACEEVLAVACANFPSPGCVVEDLIPCCAPLASCQSGEAITCTTAYFQSIR